MLDIAPCNLHKDFLLLLWLSLLEEVLIVRRFTSWFSDVILGLIRHNVDESFKLSLFPGVGASRTSYKTDIARIR